jgi:hypothetical protein
MACHPQMVLPIGRGAKLRQEEHEQASSVKERFFATNGLPFRHERFAARTSTTGKTSTRPAENIRNFLGNALLPKSQERQIFGVSTEFGAR